MGPYEITVSDTGNGYRVQEVQPTFLYNSDVDFLVKNCHFSLAMLKTNNVDLPIHMLKRTYYTEIPKSAHV